MRLRLATALVALAFPTFLSAQAAPAGVRAELAGQLDDAAGKYVALAEGIPQDKFGWRPAPGVRSVSEVFMHMVGANFSIPGIAGAKPAAGVSLPKDAERTVTDKAEIIALLKQSFAHARQATTEIAEADLDAPVKLFGQPSTKRGVLLLIATHAHEHLGQQIAYARMIGVVPKWSQRSGSGN
jgi:uncharacterized damage-inducible protein DinB